MECDGSQKSSGKATETQCNATRQINTFQSSPSSWRLLLRICCRACVFPQHASIQWCSGDVRSWKAGAEAEAEGKWKHDDVFLSRQAVSANLRFSTRHPALNSLFSDNPSTPAFVLSVLAVCNESTMPDLLFVVVELFSRAAGTRVVSTHKRVLRRNNSQATSATTPMGASTCLLATHQQRVERDSLQPALPRACMAWQ